MTNNKIRGDREVTPRAASVRFHVLSKQLRKRWYVLQFTRVAPFSCNVQAKFACLQRADHVR